MKDRVVIITGGSSGIGKALAMHFGKHGSKVLITGRKKEPLDQVKNELRSSGIYAEVFQSDVSKEDDNKAMVAFALENFGKIDVLINNAGISMRANLNDTHVDVLRKVMDINYWGTVYATKYCLPEIIKNKGSIVGVSSIAGFIGLPGRSGYSSSKFAMHGFLESVRLENLDHGVHVLIACPGFTTSNIRFSSLTSDGTPQGDSPRNEQKMMTAEDCAKYIYKATKRRKNFLVLTAQGKSAYYLKKFLPGLVRKLTYKNFKKEEQLSK